MSPRSARFFRFAAVATAAALALVGPEASAASPSGTATVAGLGLATELDLVSRGASGLVVLQEGMDLDAVSAVAYGVGGAVSRTNDLSRHGLPTRAYSRSGNGTVAMLRTSRGLVVSGEAGQPASGSTVGWVHRRTSTERLLAVQSPSTSAAPTAVQSNLDAGGSVWTWTYRGFQYVNTYDNGRQMQSSLFVQVGDRVYNPTEAGDMWSGPQQPRSVRHGSPTASASTSGATQSTRAIPLEWNPLSASPAGGPYTPVLWQDVRIGKELTLDWAGLAGVARYRTVLSLPQSLYGHLEVPTVYASGQLGLMYGVDAVTGEVRPLTPVDYDPLNPGPSHAGLEYVPFSGRGGVVAATADGQHAMAIYGVTSAAGGQVTSFAVHDFVPSTDWQQVAGFGTGQYDFSTTKLRALRSGTFPAGTSTFDTFVITGTLDEVVARMRTLAG